MENQNFKVTDIWAKTFQVCWVTNDLEKAVEELKNKFDIPKFLIMRDVQFENQIYNGKENSNSKVNAAWANGGNINLEIVHPIEGFPLEMYGDKLKKDAFDLQFHHLGARFDNDLDGYNKAVELLESKGFENKFSAGITGISKFCYFDMRELLGHYLELIYFNQEGVQFMNTLVTGEFEGE